MLTLPPSMSMPEPGFGPFRATPVAAAIEPAADHALPATFVLPSKPCYACGGDGWSRNYRGTCASCSGTGVSKV